MDVKTQASIVHTLEETIKNVKAGTCNNLLLCYEDGEVLHRHYVGNPITIIGIMASQSTMLSMEINKHDITEQID